MIGSRRGPRLLRPRPCCPAAWSPWRPGTGPRSWGRRRTHRRCRSRWYRAGRWCPSMTSSTRSLSPPSRCRGTRRTPRFRRYRWTHPTTRQPTSRFWRLQRRSAAQLGASVSSGPDVPVVRTMLSNANLAPATAGFSITLMVRESPDVLIGVVHGRHRLPGRARRQAALRAPDGGRAAAALELFCHEAHRLAGESALDIDRQLIRRTGDRRLDRLGHRIRVHRGLPGGDRQLGGMTAAVTRRRARATRRFRPIR